MEEKSSSVLPLMFVAGLILVVGGAIYFFVRGANAKLTTPVATTAINEILKSQPPAEIKFTTGTVTSSVNEKPLDPHYKLLAKTGVLVTKPKSWNSIISTLTPAGEKMLSNIDGVEKATNKDGTVTYLRAACPAAVGRDRQHQDDQPPSRPGSIHLEVGPESTRTGV